MIYIEAPNQLHVEGDATTVFLAGGIMGCPDWQSEMVDLLSDTNLVLMNPRRRDFPMDDPTAAQSQIRWEYNHLRLADRILFWFSAATLCPIVLYELGAWSRTNKRLVVGIEPGYQREQDVRIQTSLVRPDVPIVSTLEDLALSIQSL